MSRSTISESRRAPPGWGARLLGLPLILQLAGCGALLMLLPALNAAMRGDFGTLRAFVSAAVLGVAAFVAVGLSISGRGAAWQSDFRNLLSLALAYLLLPLYLAVPFREALGTTTFLNAYFEMLSCLTTTGASLFDNPARLNESLHLWRALVGWAGGLLIWVAAAAVLAPLNLGGFEVTARAEPGEAPAVRDRFERAPADKRLAQACAGMAPVYLGLTAVLWLLLVVSGEWPFTALVHAMSTLATSGISSVGGVQNGAGGLGGEMAIFAFFIFALSRLTFSSDTLSGSLSRRRPGLWYDPEFRLAVLLVAGVPLILFLRHWVGALEVDAGQDPVRAIEALWGAVFTVLSFLSTTGFESADWQAARDWSGLGTPGLVLLGLALVGGGVATTAGGVKLLRIYALFLHERRELELLIHPSSLGHASAGARRLRRFGAQIAWVFFMLFALSLSLVVVVLGAFGVGMERAMILAIAALSTTGPLIKVAADVPIRLAEMGAGVKLVLAMAMVLGRLETLALIALLNPAQWRR